MGSFFGRGFFLKFYLETSFKGTFFCKNQASPHNPTVFTQNRGVKSYDIMLGGVLFSEMPSTKEERACLLEPTNNQKQWLMFAPPHLFCFACLFCSARKKTNKPKDSPTHPKKNKRLPLFFVPRTQQKLT